jgi:hypothetical protein
MAASGFTPISLYYSTTASAVPTSGNLANGELGLNIADMKLYAKNSAGTVTLLASNAGASGSVTSVAATVPAFLSIAGSPITTSGTLAITLSGTALPVANGGTGLTTTPANGALDIGNGTGFTRTTLTAGTGVTITNASGAITINATGTGGTVTSVDVSGGTTGLTTSGGPITTSGTITLAGTLAVANGGTGLTTLTANRIPFGNGTSAFQSSANLTFSSGTDLTVGGGTVYNSSGNRGNITIEGPSSAILNFGINGTLGGYIYHGGTDINFRNSKNGVISFEPNSAQRFVFGAAGQFGIGGTPDYGTAGQVLTSGGASAAPTWAAAAGGISIGKSIAMAMIFGF